MRCTGCKTCRKCTCNGKLQAPCNKKNDKCQAILLFSCFGEGFSSIMRKQMVKIFEKKIQIYQETLAAGLQAGTSRFDANKHMQNREICKTTAEHHQPQKSVAGAQKPAVCLPAADTRTKCKHTIA